MRCLGSVGERAGTASLMWCGLMGLAHSAVYTDLMGEDTGHDINKKKNNVLGTVLGDLIANLVIITL